MATVDPLPASYADRIAYELMGTCDSLGNILERHELEWLENSTDFCLALDAICFCCETCGWWFEQSEMADEGQDEWVCEECYREGE
jgi:hypothetical protein